MIFNPLDSVREQRIKKALQESNLEEFGLILDDGERDVSILCKG